MSRFRCIEGTGDGTTLVVGHVYDGREDDGMVLMNDGTGLYRHLSRFVPVPDATPLGPPLEKAKIFGVWVGDGSDRWDQELGKVLIFDTYDGALQRVKDRDRFGWVRGVVHEYTDGTPPKPRTVEGLARSGITNKIDFSRAPFVPIDPAALARALFDEEMERDAKRACEYSARTVPGPYADACDRIADADAEVRRILDIMWSGKDGARSTKPDVRKRAEGLAERVVARMGRPR